MPDKKHRASTIIRKTMELGDDCPVITIALLDIVTGIIFTAMMGAGLVIAIGVIVLPILMCLGIPKAIAMFSAPSIFTTKVPIKALPMCYAHRGRRAVQQSDMASPKTEFIVEDLISKIYQKKYSDSRPPPENVKSLRWIMSVPMWCLSIKKCFKKGEKPKTAFCRWYPPGSPCKMPFLLNFFLLS